jgi:rare lipoprotein A (peptidoglycan hydrolase)
MKKNDFKFKKLGYAEIDEYKTRNFTRVIITILVILAVIALVFVSKIHSAAQAPVEQRTETVEKVTPPVINSGTASWYDYRLDGILWSADHNTAASRDLVRYSYARVTNKANGKSVIIFVNDYGPEEWTGREIDLSSHAFAEISDLSLGLAEVEIEPLDS